MRAPAARNDLSALDVARSAPDSIKSGSVQADPFSALRGTPAEQPIPAGYPVPIRQPVGSHRPNLQPFVGRQMAPAKSSSTGGATNPESVEPDPSEDSSPSSAHSKDSATPLEGGRSDSESAPKAPPIDEKH